MTNPRNGDARPPAPSPQPPAPSPAPDGLTPDWIARIDECARVCPERPAHVSGARVLTYGELTGRSHALAARLLAEAPGDRAPVAILGHKEPEMLVGFVAAARARRPYVPIDSGIPEARQARILELSGATQRLTVEDIARDSEGDAKAPIVAGSVDDPYYVKFTSGSTGEPNGVVITWGCLADFVAWMLEEHRFDVGEVFLNQALLSFDLSVMDVYCSLATGGTLFSLSRDDIADLKQLFQVLERSGVTTWVSTPSFARVCLLEPRFGRGMLPAVRRFWFCGETLAPTVAAQLLERFPGAEVWNTYGPTEATVATTSIRIDAAVLAAHEVLPVGRAKPRSRAFVVDPLTGAMLPEGERGEIVIAGPNVSPGYLGKAELNARKFFHVDGERAYRTGDFGHVSGGLVFFDGRMDDQVKLHGHRIELGDIEANVRALPGVRDAAVVPVIKGGLADALVAFVVLSEPPAEPDAAVARRLRQAIGERVPTYMVPRRVTIVPEFPLTPNGKVDRRKLAGQA